MNAIELQTTRRVVADARFDRHFGGRLMQIFLYVTDECNIRCTQCFYKPSLKKGHAEMPTDVALSLLQKFRNLGAVKVSFLGGEPTLYGQAPGNQPLPYLVKACRRMGYEYIRLVTNGLFDDSLLSDDRLQEIDEITFSFDGDNPQIHNSIRGRGTFERSIRRLQAAVQLGYAVHVTMCAHRGNIGQTEDGTPILSRAIKWAASIGVKSMNIHPILRMGVPRDGWTGETEIDPHDWISTYRMIQTSIRKGEFDIPVRLPIRFANKSEFNESPKLHGYCSVKLADRLDVHRNGQMHTCTLHNSSTISVATFEESADHLRINWTKSGNELDQASFKDSEEHPCAVMKLLPGTLLPLCVSLKPGQDEFVWNRLHIQ
jgi:molybdenum cofactor biosynthesis enzyme MoaA